MQMKQTRGSYRKRFIAALLIITMVIGTIGFNRSQAYAASSASEVRVMIAGHFVDFEGQQPIHQGGRVLVPVRGVFTLMGFTPTWDGDTNTATLDDGVTRIVIPIGQPTFTVNGRVVTPDVPQQNIAGRVVIPLRAVTEAIGGTAHWDDVNRIAVITPPADMIERVHANIGAGTGAPQPAIEGPVITTTALPDAGLGHAYSHTLQSTGATPITWSVASGTLPPGLTLNTAAGAITGTPTALGTFNFTVLAQNAAGIDMRVMSIRVETQQFTVTFNANGGAGTMTPQNFQPGVSQRLRNNAFTRTGYVFAGWSSTPTGALQFDNNQNITITANHNLYAIWTRGTAPSITTTTLSNAVVGQAYSQTIAATGTAPITWGITAGNLPAGLSLNTATGAITGTPTAAALTAAYVFNFTVRVQNAAGESSRQFSITVQSAPVTVPNVIGRTLADAQAYLAQTPRYFTSTVVEHRYSDAPAGEIIFQSPVAGSPLAPRGRVDLIVSHGPAPTPTPEPPPAP